MISLLLAASCRIASFAPVDAVFSDGFVALKSRDGHLALLDSGSPYSLAGTAFPFELSDGSTVRLRAADVAFDRPVSGLSIVGVIGCDWLRDKQLLVDYASRKVSVRSGADLTPAEAAEALATPATGGALQKVGKVKRTISVPLEGRADLYTVVAQIGNSRCSLLFDTGANVLSLSRALLDRSPKVLVKEETLAVAEGGRSLKTFRIPKVTVSDILIPSMRVFEDPFGQDDGTIGAWMLSRDRVLIDFPGLKVWVAKP